MIGLCSARISLRGDWLHRPSNTSKFGCGVPRLKGSYSRFSPAIIDNSRQPVTLLPAHKSSAQVLWAKSRREEWPWVGTPQLHRAFRDREIAFGHGGAQNRQLLPKRRAEWRPMGECRRRGSPSITHDICPVRARLSFIGTSPMDLLPWSACYPGRATIRHSQTLRRLGAGGPVHLRGCERNNLAATSLPSEKIGS